MHNDTVVWNLLHSTRCAYLRKVVTQKFCRHSYNVTGLCTRVSCPLANGSYATVIEDEGKLFLCLKTVERIHTPRRTWEKIELPQNYPAALKLIDLHMTNVYRGHQINRCKLRLTRLRQTLIRMRKLLLQPQVTYVPVKKKIERREATREKKAEIAARIELAIEQELLERLRAGVYGDIYNFNQKEFERLLDSSDRKQRELEEQLEAEGEEEAVVDDEVFSDIEDAGGSEDAGDGGSGGSYSGSDASGGDCSESDASGGDASDGGASDASDGEDAADSDVAGASDASDSPDDVEALERRQKQLSQKYLKQLKQRAERKRKAPLVPTTAVQQFRAKSRRKLVQYERAAPERAMHTAMH